MELLGAQPGTALGAGPSASIRNLSDETILDILESGYLGRRDLMHLCLACKRLRRIAIRPLYKIIHIVGDHRLHQLFRSILQNISLGDAVKALTVEWHGSADGDDAPEDSNHQIKDFEDISDEKDLRSLVAVARTRTMDHDILQALARGSESAKVIILISSLPNLRVLSVQPPYSGTLFDSHFPRLAAECRSFPNLRQFGRSWHDTEGAFYLGLLFPAMLIPSVTTIVVYTASTGEDEYENEEGPGPGTSNVTCLALEHSNVTGSGLSKILRIPKGLKYFSFSNGGATVDFVSCSRENFGRALAYTSQTLEYLSIIEWDCDGEEDMSTLGSLQDFEKLRVLSVELDVLLGCDSHAAVDLARVLPHTLEQLFLLCGQNDSWTEAEYIQSVERLICAKSNSSTPVLQLIVIEPEPRLLAPLLNLAAERGIVLASCNSLQPKFPYKTFPTPWYPYSEEALSYR